MVKALELSSNGCVVHVGSNSTPGSLLFKNKDLKVRANQKWPVLLMDQSYLLYCETRHKT